MSGAKVGAGLPERIMGAMLGLACGDALGAPAEFKNQATVQQMYGTLQDMIGGGIWNPGEWTDDTGMALCVAEGILADPNDPVEAIGQRFVIWAQTSKDVGSTISAALREYHRLQDWPGAAQSTPQAQQGKAGGNGSLMRTLPVALAYPDVDILLRQSACISAMTHWDPQAEACCAVYNLWIYHLLQGIPASQAWSTALELVASLPSVSELPDAVGLGPLPDGFWQRLRNVETLRYAELQPSGYAGYVVECLEAAAWCVLSTHTLEECLIQAVNLAGEADTIAAVAGGAAGAFYGAEAIPQRWLNSLYQRAHVEHVAKRLSDLRRHLKVYATPNLPALNSNNVTERIVAGRNPLTCRDVEILAAQGITHILDLREAREWAAPKYGAEAVEEIERCGLHRLSLPIVDMGAPTPEELEAAYRFMKETLQHDGSRIYIHCRAGVERTAAILIGYYARHYAVSYDEALAKLREGRPILNPLSQQEHAVRRWLDS